MSAGPHDNPTQPKGMTAWALHIATAVAISVLTGGGMTLTSLVGRTAALETRQVITEHQADRVETKLDKITDGLRKLETAIQKQVNP
jgi:hypothetical protein